MSTIEERVKKSSSSSWASRKRSDQSASFVDDLGADSLDTVELVMALEEEFGRDPGQEARRSRRSSSDRLHQGHVKA